MYKVILINVTAHKVTFINVTVNVGNSINITVHKVRNLVKHVMFPVKSGYCYKTLQGFEITCLNIAILRTYFQLLILLTFH